MTKKSKVSKKLFLDDLTDGFEREITGDFWNMDPYYPYKPHIGIDYGANIGECLIAYDDYEVIGINSGHSDYGNHIFLYFPKIDKTGHYAHLSEINVSLGETGKKYDVIALSGNSGKSTGPHLHFGFANGKIINTIKGIENNPWINFESYEYPNTDENYMNLLPLYEYRKYGFYNLDTVPIAKNIDGYLLPYDLEGISYLIIEWVEENVVKVKSRDFGEIKLYVDTARSTITKQPTFWVP